MKRKTSWPVVILGSLGVVLVLGLGLAFLHPASPLLRDQARRATRQNLVRVVVALERFRDSAGGYPARLQELVQRHDLPRDYDILDLSRGSGMATLLEYSVAADGRSYDLFAVGPDGLPDTPDDIRPPIPDSLVAYTGYRPAR